MATYWSGASAGTLLVARDPVARAFPKAGIRRAEALHYVTWSLAMAKDLAPPRTLGVAPAPQESQGVGLYTKITKIWMKAISVDLEQESGQRRDALPPPPLGGKGGPFPETSRTFRWFQDLRTSENGRTTRRTTAAFAFRTDDDNQALLGGVGGREMEWLRSERDFQFYHFPTGSPWASCFNLLSLHLLTGEIGKPPASRDC